MKATQAPWRNAGSIHGTSSTRKKKQRRRWSLRLVIAIAVAIASMTCYFGFLIFFVVSFESELANSGNTNKYQQPHPGRNEGHPGDETINHIRPAVERAERNLPFALDRFRLNLLQAEAILSKTGGSKLIRKVMTAYTEPAMVDEIPGTGNQGDVNDDKDVGFPPDFVIPLPLRRTAPEHLHKFEYPAMRTCHDVPEKIPVDRGFQVDAKGNTINRNVAQQPTADDFPLTEAPFCPVDADPFLPWLHDFFPSIDGSQIHFVAQNKRRCNTGKEFRKDVKRLEPQVALMQPVSVKRVGEMEARNLAPELWYPKEDTDSYLPPRYMLTPIEDSDPDAQFTRFICRFHTIDLSDAGEPRTVMLGETLSTYPFNYEFVNYRKHGSTTETMLTPEGKDNAKFWLSNIRYECPVPPDPELRRLVASGETILSDGTATIHVDVIPIRTSPRYGMEYHFTEDMAGPKEQWITSMMAKKSLWPDRSAETQTFNATRRWGNRNVMPRIEASGRWENIPICSPPRPGQSSVPRKSADGADKSHLQNAGGNSVPTSGKKQFDLSACVWSSASFKTRGTSTRPTLDTLQRLEEWLEFHFMVGFDHVFVYDNSGAHTNETSLAPVLDRYPASKVTRIDWPSIPCNNNIPMHDNTGERSSQYAAENSCRTRFAPFSEWIASFDTDEYLVPLGKYRSLKEIVKDAEKSGTNILSFRSTRSKLREDGSENINRKRRKLQNMTFLEAYNCDSNQGPKPSWAERARKQVYRSDYVLTHFVHYSTVTKGYLSTFKEAKTEGKHWQAQYKENSPSQRVINDVEEATMMHTKTVSEEDTFDWLSRCRYDFDKKWKGCHVGIPHPKNIRIEGAHREDNIEYNCFPVERLTNFWIQRLKQALSTKEK